MGGGRVRKTVGAAALAAMVAVLAPISGVVPGAGVASAATATGLAVTGLDVISGGETHTCSTTTSQGVSCWGANDSGQLGTGAASSTSVPYPVEVSGLPGPVAQVSAGSNFTCARTVAGAAWCWGSNHLGKLGDGTTTASASPVAVSGLGTGVTAISAGGSTACAVQDGGVWCWGSNSTKALGDGVTAASSSVPVSLAGLTSGIVDVSVGGGWACALNTGGGVGCWGTGPLTGAAGVDPTGAGTATTSATPLTASGLGSGVASLDVGGELACAVTTAGGARCWGRNGAYLGANSTAVPTTPKTPIGLSSGVVAVAVGSKHGCALTTAGAIRCWGGGAGIFLEATGQSGQVGNGTWTTQLTPVTAVASGAVGVAAGTAQSCARLVDGRSQCWGYNDDGALGLGYDTTESSLWPVEGMGTAGAIVSVEPSLTCATDASAGAWCWGKSDHGQLGSGTLVASAVPRAVTGMSSGVTDLDVGLDYACAVVNSGAKCWGTGGRLGRGTGGDALTPVSVSGQTSGIADIAAGSTHACSVSTSGAVRCWGGNNNGQLGNGTTSGTTVDIPVAVSGLSSGVQKVEVGSGVSCALTTAGGVKCWGVASKLGNGTSANATVPVDVTGLSSGVVALSTGTLGSCVVTTEGGVRCWGSNSLGGGASSATVPTPVPGLSSGVVDVVVGGGACARMATGEVRCWSTSPPAPVEGLGSHVTAVSSVNSTLCAVEAGQLLCKGDDRYGQMGSGRPLATRPLFVAYPVPEIAATRAPAANAAGWSKAPVTVSYWCRGGFEPLACPAPAVVGQGTGQSRSGTVIDVVGQRATATVGNIDVDLSPPAAFAVTAEHPVGGWFRDDVHVTWNCSDGLSGVASCPAPATITGEGTGLTASPSGPVFDLAGNRADASGVTVQIDRTPPATSASTVPTWATSGITVDLSASDNLSGVATTYHQIDGGAPVTGPVASVTGDGTHQLAFWSVDVAGNTEAAHEVTVQIDAGAPTIAAEVSPAPNPVGWTDGPTTVSFTCDDATSGVASCTSPLTVGEDGSTDVTGTAVDQAGNTATVLQTVHVDATPPQIDATVTPAPDPSGTYRGPVTVHFTCNDATSGIVTCPADQDITDAGTRTTTGTAVDAAGNSASASVDTQLTIAVGSSVSPSVVGQAVSLRGTTTLGAGGTMTFYDGATSLGAKAVSVGAATLATSKLAVGTHSITVSYKATSTSTAVVSAPFTLLVSRGTTTATLTSPVEPSVWGQAVKFKATIAAVSPAVGVPTGSVTFYDGATSVGTASLVSGAASLTLRPTVGTHQLTAVYNGSASFSGTTSSPLDQHVDPAATTAVVSSSANPSVSGQAITLKATVKTVAPGVGTPTGTVDFYDGATLLGSASLSSSTASLTGLRPMVGDHPVIAIYRGSANSLPSTSTTFTQTVGKAATAVAITSSFPTTTLGHTGSITATVRTLSPGSGVPAGIVELYDDGTLLATRTLVGGKTSIAIASLPVGVHDLTAVYLGSTTNLGSTSPSFAQTIT